MHRSICIDTQQFHGRPANCAHLLDFNVGHGFYAAFNNAASNPQKSHPPIYNGNANRSPSQVLLLKSSEWRGEVEEVEAVAVAGAVV